MQRVRARRFTFHLSPAYNCVLFAFVFERCLVLLFVFGSLFFLAHAVRARGSDGHQNVLWSVNYSQVVREQVKCKKPDVFRMPKQNNPETQTQTKHNKKEDTQ